MMKSSSTTAIIFLLTLEFSLSIGAVDAPQLSDGPGGPQVEHDHVHPDLQCLPWLSPLTHCRALLQQKQERQDMGEGGVGQRAAFCRTELMADVQYKRRRARNNKTLKHGG